MTCTEFQRALPYIIETGGNPDEEGHLRTCQVCSDLVQDLKYIAEQAKLLVPMEEPHPRVWDGIRTALERDGAARGARGRLLGSKAAVPWMVAVTAVVIAALAGLLLNRETAPTAEQSAAVVAAPARASAADGLTTSDADDQLLLSAVEPAMRSTYEDTLKLINESISDARQTVEQNPEDTEAREYLMKAYEQKAMLYDMAMQSLE